MKRFASGLLAVLALPALASEPIGSVADLRSCVARNAPEKSMVQTLRMIATDAEGAKQLSLRMSHMDLQRELGTRVEALAPPDLAGAVFLMRMGQIEDLMYLYLPSIQRIRQVSGAMSGEPLWGTDFSYEDLKLFRGLFDYQQAEFAGSGRWHGRRTAEVKVQIDPAFDPGYRSVVLRFDAQSCLVVDARFDDAEGLVKQVSIDHPDDIAQRDGRYWAKRIRAVSPREGTATTLLIDEVAFDVDLPLRMFNPRSFHLVSE